MAELDKTSLSPGQIIEARSRLWRVDSIKDNVLEAAPIDGVTAGPQKFYLPLEDIKRGELEPPSPSTVGNLAEQKLLLRGFKLDLIHSTAPILSLQRSRVIPEEYQLVPLIMSMEMPRVRMLVADDVGLGKTIEAGLIVKELIERNRAKRVLVVCPANLREQWQNALEYFFHFDARIISTRHKRAMERELPPGANPWEHYDMLVASIDYVKKDPTIQHVLEQEWDVVLIDEAHNCAKPHQTQESQRVDMQRWEFAQKISERCQHLLLLTATPHNGYSDSYASLLRLLDEALVSGPAHDPRIKRERAKQYVCQRRREDILDWVQSSSDRDTPFPERDQDEISIPMSLPQRRAIEKIEAFTDHLTHVAKGERQKYRRMMATWTIMHFHKRAISSPHALIKSLQNRIRKVEARIEDIETEDTTGITPSEAKAVALDEDPGEKLSDEEARERLERETFGQIDALKQELRLLQDALESAEKVTPSRDEKLQRMKSLVYEQLRIKRHKPKLIVFTKYQDTLEYLADHLESDDRFKDAEILTLHGSMTDGQRNDTFFEFEDAQKAVLIATDCISEGIDLQYMASQIVHYELPWNPNRLEQRNGRIDRYGQQEKMVYIRTLVMEDRLDAAILQVLVKKAEQIRRDYGFAPPFFGDDTTVMDLIREAGMELSLNTQTSLLEFGEDGPKRGGINPFSNETIDRIRGDSFYGQTRVDLGEVQERLEETRETVGSKEEIEKFVVSGLKRYGVGVEEKDGIYSFNFNNATLGYTPAEDMSRVTFNPYRAANNPRLTLVDLGHPLVRHLIENIKISTFQEADRYGRTAHMTTPAAREVSAVYHLLVRYTVQTDPITILEEILPVGTPVYREDILSQDELERLLNASPMGRQRGQREVAEALEAALNRDLQAMFEDKVEERRSQISRERRRLKDKFDADWVKGIDRVRVASIDLLTTTIYYPHLGGDTDV